MQRPGDEMIVCARATALASIVFVALALATANARPLTPSHGFHVLYKFCSQPTCTDSGEPLGGLIVDSVGNIYGTTYGGGNTACYQGCGAVFKFAPDGTYSVLYAFSGGSDGANPIGSLIMDANGNLYGMTQNGGKYCAPAGCGGTIFKLTPDGTKSVLHSFGADGDGVEPAEG